MTNSSFLTIKWTILDRPLNKKTKKWTMICTTIMYISCIYLPNARYLDIHVYMAWSHRDPRCRNFRYERALDCCTSDHVFERLLHKSGNIATIQPNQTTSRELSRERWHRMRKVLICPPSPNSCKLICLLNIPNKKDLCKYLSSCPQQNCWSN